MSYVNHDRLCTIRQQVAATLAEIARIERTPQAQRNAADDSRLIDLHARVGMMRMLYGDGVTGEPL